MSRIEPVPGNQPSTQVYAWSDRLVEELTGFDYEARDYPRTKLTSDIVVRATNGSGSIFGTSFNAVTTDISASGIGFLHTCAVPDRFLAITLGRNGSRVYALVEVVRCRSVGQLYEVGVRFIRRLETVES